MELKLPPRHDGSTESIDADSRKVLIIGANGAGKTRFTGSMIELAGDRAVEMSALQAIYGDNSAMWVLSTLPAQTLDRLVELWEEVFPGNEILLEDGRMLFHDNRSGGAGSRSVLRLSDGEKAVLYYIGAALTAEQGSILFIDNPTQFLHSTIALSLWDKLEDIRLDCQFVYTTHDIAFASSRLDNTTIWVRQFDPYNRSWDYRIIPPNSGALPDDIFLSIIGARQPVLFIEGDDTHSIDAKLYPLIFKGYTIKSLGSCDKVIESVRTFNDLQGFHHLESHGIVDRDRRDEHEVAYLRRKGILVPEVAEIENALMSEEVIRAVARYRHRDENHVFAKVKKAIVHMFNGDLKVQALQHTRHHVKRLAEYRIDGQFHNINMLEKHLTELVKELNPRGLYEDFCLEFHRLVNDDDYAGILKVYNFKAMIQQSNLPQLLGLNNRNDYIRTLLQMLRTDHSEAERARAALRALFR